MHDACLKVVGSVRDSLESAGVGCTDAVLVACSGGADSSVLADVVMELSRSGEVGLVTLVNIDHGLRRNTSADAAVVETLAELGGAKFHRMVVNVDRNQASLEDAARQARYEALESALEFLGARWILTAHTASDQAETLMMRLIRGTGIVGLAAIPRTRDRIVRPLLDVTRAEVEQYREARDIGAIEDPSNSDRQFARNRMRHDILPMLRGENPRLDEALCRLANAAAEQRAALDYAADQLLIRSADSARRIDVRDLLAAPSAVVKRALSIAAVACGGEPLEARHLAALERLIRRPAKGTVQLDMPGVAAIREYGVISFRAPGFVPPLPMRRVVVRGPKPPYKVRRWLPGDRMRPSRLRGRSRKLSDLYGDAKIPRLLRPDSLVVACQVNGSIEWAEHLGPAWQTKVEVTLRTQSGN